MFGLFSHAHAADAKIYIKKPSEITGTKQIFVKDKLLKIKPMEMVDIQMTEREEAAITHSNEEEQKPDQE